MTIPHGRAPASRTSLERGSPLLSRGTIQYIGPAWPACPSLSATNIQTRPHEDKAFRAWLSSGQLSALVAEELLAAHPRKRADLAKRSSLYHHRPRAERRALAYLEGRGIDRATMARIADTLADPRTIERLRQVCERWIYSACLCFALDSQDQERTGFHYAYSIYQVEYSRNLLFVRGAQLEEVFQRMVDRTRARVDVRQVRTLFGTARRPRWHWKRRPRMEVVLETPVYDLTVFKLHFGKLTLKAYTKGEHVLRFEVVVHNTKDLGCGRVLARCPEIVARLRCILERFLSALDCVNVAFIGDETLDQLPLPARVARSVSAALISTSRACGLPCRPFWRSVHHRWASAWPSSEPRSRH